jgi:hypothetical protein
LVKGNPQSALRKLDDTFAPEQFERMVGFEAISQGLAGDF